MKGVVIVLSFLLFAVFIGCGPKKVPEPVVDTQEVEAFDAIEMAEEAIMEAETEGADVSEAQELLEEAKTAFSDKDFLLAIVKANNARVSAEGALEEIEKARQEALTAAEEEAIRVHVDTYTVGTWKRDRDCLWNISQKEHIYGDPWKWKKIYRANTDKIRDPDLIYPKQILEIPE